MRFVNSKPLENLASHGIKEFAKIENGVPEQPTSALQVSDIWHKIKGHIGPNLAFLYGGHNLGRRATKKEYVCTKYIHIYMDQNPLENKASLNRCQIS
jgi:hypothetical protein